MCGFRCFVSNGLMSTALVCVFTILVAWGNVLLSQETSQINRLSPEEIESGWISLFDGKSLFGWHAESNADWAVSDDAIRVSTGDVGLLRTTSQFDSFELDLEFSATAETNSGVFVLTSPKPKSPATDCYEINIINPQLHEYATGSIVARQKSKSSPELKIGDWHSMKITAIDNKIEVTIDNVLASSFEDEQPLGRGFIGLQFNKGAAAFRNIKLRPLKMSPWLNGEDLSNWNLDSRKEATIDLTAEKTLRIQGGPGQIESKKTLGDFVLSTQARTNVTGINSGIFFRSIPGELMNGYECQINNSQRPDQAGLPADCGTGGIFRRQDARAIVAQDKEWFSLTIVACGPHIATWVNGFQVADWSDQREPHPNPRKGLRLEAGTIILQAHDSKTDVEFKNIQVRELKKRNR